MTILPGRINIRIYGDVVKKKTGVAIIFYLQPYGLNVFTASEKPNIFSLSSALGTATVTRTSPSDFVCDLSKKGIRQVAGD